MKDEPPLSLKRSTTELSTVGEKLKYTRESRGLSQQEIAKALCLPVHVIDALEREAFEELPARVFVRGYLINYARFLQLPLRLDENIASDNVSAFQPKQPVVFSTIWGSVLLHILLKLLNYGVFIILLVLIFLWQYKKHHAAEKELSIVKVSTQDNISLSLPSPPESPDISWLNAQKGSDNK